MPKPTIDDMHRIARSKGGQCLSEEYVSGRTKLKWRCAKGHEWESTPHNVKRGYWCRKCHLEKIHNIRRLTIEYMHTMARSKGGRCLSKSYLGINVKLKWQCKDGHIWETTPASVRYGSWCPKCGGKLKGTIKEMRKIAEARGGECLSKEYVNSQTKIKWTCSKEHIWEAIPASVKQGRWCRRCAAKNRRVKKTEYHNLQDSTNFLVISKRSSAASRSSL